VRASIAVSSIDGARPDRDVVGALVAEIDAYALHVARDHARSPTRSSRAALPAPMPPRPWRKRRVDDDVGLAIARLARSCQRLQLCQRSPVSNGRSPLPDNRVASVGPWPGATPACAGARPPSWHRLRVRRRRARSRPASGLERAHERRALAHAERRFTVARKDGRNADPAARSTARSTSMNSRPSATRNERADRRLNRNRPVPQNRNVAEPDQRARIFSRQAPT